MVLLQKPQMHYDLDISHFILMYTFHGTSYIAVVCQRELRLSLHIYNFYLEIDLAYVSTENKVQDYCLNKFISHSVFWLKNFLIPSEAPS